MILVSNPNVFFLPASSVFIFHYAGTRTGNGKNIVINEEPNIGLEYN